MRIGLLSDTHGHFDAGLTRLFAGCDRIVHAGDVVGPEVLLLLSSLAPVTAVRGNNDLGALGEGLPEEAEVALEGLKGLVLHELGRPERPLPSARRLIELRRPDLVVYGHSHSPAVAVVGGVLFINPGGAGRRRFHLPRTAAILTVNGRSARVEFADLDAGLAEWGSPSEVDL